MLQGGHFKTDAQRSGGDTGRKLGGASEAALKISKVLEKIAEAKKTQITSVALAYVMHKTSYVFPIVGGRKIDHLKGNIDGLRLELTEQDISEIEGANAFDIGFPQSFLAGPQHPNGVKNPGDVWLMSAAGEHQHADLAPKVFQPQFPDSLRDLLTFVGSWTGEEEPRCLDGFQHGNSCSTITVSAARHVSRGM